MEHAAPHKRAKVETVLVGDIRAEYQLDVSVKDDALDDLPDVECKVAKSIRKARTPQAKVVSHAPKAKTKAASKTHPYLRRSETVRRR